MGEQKGKKGDQDLCSGIQCGVQKIGNASPQKKDQKESAACTVFLNGESKDQKIENKHGNADPVSAVKQRIQVGEKG